MALYSRSNEKTFTVEAVSGGWVFVWSDPSIDDEFDRKERGGMSWPSLPRPASSGRLIFTDRKKLMKHIDGFIAA